MSDDVSSMIKLIQNLTQNSQDDEDFNNIVLEKFQSPTEMNQLGESVTVRKWTGPYTWATKTQATFTRASISNNSVTGETVMPNYPRFVPTPAPFGKGLLVEETTTNYVKNSDFMTINSSTGTYFSDTILNDLGPWDVDQGEFVFDPVRGATAQVSGVDSILVTGNPNWKGNTSALGGWAVELQFQLHVVTGDAPTNGGDGACYLYKDVNNWYRAVISSGYFYLQEKVNGGGITTLTSSTFTQLNNTRYCINFSIDANNLLSTQLYLDTSSGNLLGDLSATSTSLQPGFRFACGGYKGISFQYATVWGPSPLSWNCNQSWSDVICLGPSITSKGYNSLQISHNMQGAPTTFIDSPASTSGALASTTWTLSFTAACSHSGTIQLSGLLGPMASGGLSSYLSTSVSVLDFAVPNVPQVFTITGTFPSNETATSVLVRLRPPLAERVTISYGGIQLEKDAYATSHHRNDSTTSTSARAVEALTVSTSGFSPTAGTLNMWVLVNPNTQRRVSGVNPKLFDITNAGGYSCLTVFHSGITESWFVRTADNAGTIINGPNVPDVSLGWHMFTLRWSPGACDFLVDGVIVSTVPSPVLSTAFGSTAYLGIYKDGLSWSLDSVIQDITVFNRSLSDGEVLDGYLSNAPLFTDSTAVLKLPLNGDLNITPYPSFNWNQGGVYI